MTIDELKSKVEAYRTGLKEKSGFCVCGDAGPIGMAPIDELVAMIESQQLRIEKLEKHSR